MDEQKLKVIFFIVFLLFDIILLFVNIISFNWLVLFVFILSIVLTVFFGYLLTLQKSALNDLLEYHKLKETLLQQKSNLQKQYMKRLISEKQFKIQLNSLDKQIFDIDFKLDYSDLNVTKEKELKIKIEYLQKKYFKRDIPEDIYNDLQIDLSRKLSEFNNKRI